MRAIASPFFDASPAMLGPLVALVFFVVVFVLVLVVVSRARPAALERAASLPLGDDGQVSEPRSRISEEQS